MCSFQARQACPYSGTRTSPVGHGIPRPSHQESRARRAWNSRSVGHGFQGARRPLRCTMGMAPVALSAPPLAQRARGQARRASRKGSLAEPRANRLSGPSGAQHCSVGQHWPARPSKERPLPATARRDLPRWAFVVFIAPVHAPNAALVRTMAQSRSLLSLSTRGLHARRPADVAHA